MRIFLAAITLLIGYPAWSAEFEVGNQNSTIAQLLKYSDASSGNIAGDLVIDVSNPVNASVCRGAYVPKSDAQYADVLQIAITAQATGAAIRVLAETTQTWPGSSDKYCRLTVIVLR